MQSRCFEWTVIGAGPSGIAAIGKLLDYGINGEDVLWIDPEFLVGDLGKYWYLVSSNTKVKLFNDFLFHCKSFNYNIRKKQFRFDNLLATDTCRLELVVEPLNFITKQLQQQVNYLSAHVKKLCLSNRLWHMTLTDKKVLKSKNVILATGATPKSIPITNSVETISVYDALNNIKLAKKCKTSDRVAVFGSSHSAIMIIRELLDIGVKEVINFYRGPLRFAVDFGDWILFDDTGLKGTTAVWARENINGKMPLCLTRIISNDENIIQKLPLCTKVIYAIGFNSRSPIIEDYPNHAYNPYNGIIAPGLFGVGIGFPESKTDRYGNPELRVGLWKFISYLNQILPVWLKYGA